MESTGAFHDGDWIPNMMFSSEEQLEFTPLIFGQFSLPHEHFEGSNFAQLTFCPTSDANNICLDSGVNDNLVHSLGSFNSSMHYISQENNSYSSYNSIAFTPSSVEESHHHFQVSNGISMSLDACVMDQKNCASHMTDFNTDIVMGEISLIKEEASNDHVMLMNSNDKEATVSSISEKELQLKRKVDVPQPTDSTQICNKKPRVPRDVLKCKKNVQSKKNQKGGVTNGKDEENKKGQEGQSSCCYSSEEDNGSQERNGREISETKTSATDPNLIGKTRASRGSATDPQSLYARKRRERINERLRILQNLIPNGTKVDISTMLEEAVSYVKFLQLQIKLLSSDDLWMYAPIAYNGVDIGFTQKISPLL